jgi:uncharacterized protein (TIGR02246 family)
MRRREWIVTVACGLILGGCAAVQTADSDEKAVRATVAAFAEAWNRHDIDALANLLTPDAEYVIITAQRWKGRQEFHRYLSHLHGTVAQASTGLPAQFYGIQKTITYRFDKVDVRLITRDVAVAAIEWTQLGDPRFPDPRTGTLTLIVTRQGPRWLIESGHNTQAPPKAR